MSQWKWYVYIIECLDGSYYTGLTWKLDLRWSQHLTGFGSKYTTKHPPKALVYIEEHEDLETARLRERQIKDWSRIKKEKLIKGEWGKWYLLGLFFEQAAKGGASRKYNNCELLDSLRSLEE